MQIFKSFKMRDLVAEQRQICQFCQIVQSLYLLNQVKGEIKPFETDKVIQVLDLGNDVIV